MTDPSGTGTTRCSQSSSPRLKIVTKLLSSYPQTMAAPAATYAAYVEATMRHFVEDMRRGVELALQEHPEWPPTATQFEQCCGIAFTEREREQRRALAAPGARESFRDRVVRLFGLADGMKLLSSIGVERYKDLILPKGKDPAEFHSHHDYDDRGFVDTLRLLDADRRAKVPAGYKPRSGTLEEALAMVNDDSQWPAPAPEMPGMRHIGAAGMREKLREMVLARMEEREAEAR